MRWFIAALIFLLTAANAYADSGTVKLEEFTYRIIYCSQIDKVLFVQWNEDMKKSLLKICNPLDFKEEKIILLDDFFDNVFLLQSGNCWLIFADHSNEQGYVETGSLRKVDFETGEIIAEIDFDRDFNSLFVDHNQKYAYVYSGHEKGRLYKVDIEDFEIVADIMQFGMCEAMAFSLDDRKIYISDDSDITIPSPSSEKSPGEFEEYGPKQRFFPVSVYDTQDLTNLTAIMTIMSSDQLFMLDDGRLAFLGYCFEQDPSPDIMVVDTQTDEIVEILDLGDFVIGDAGIDKRHHKIFATIAQRAEPDPEYPEYPNYQDSGFVLEINLDDYSHRLIEVSDKPLLRITVIPTDTGTRLLCIEKPESENADVFLHYLDVE